MREDGDEERYLERLNVKDGDKKGADSPLSVYENLDHPDDIERDGHVESDMERARELEKA